MSTNAQNNQTQKCPHCGALMREYWHRLTPGLVSALVKLHRAVRYYNRNRIHIHDDMKIGAPSDFRLTDNEWTNFTKLRFHALAAKIDDKSNHSGYWLITHRGAQFLRGLTAVPQRVKTYRNRVIDHDEKLVTMSDYRRKVPWFEREFDYDIAAPEPKVEAPALVHVCFETAYRFEMAIAGKQEQRQLFR